MAVDTSVVGRTTMRSRVVVERGAVANFAMAVTDDSPLYKDAAAAHAAGLPGIPAPPTFSFAMRAWGEFPELQHDIESVEDNPLAEVMGRLMANGGLILHGEQSFELHRPVVVGDVLCGEGKVVDVYERASGERTMTFVVVETVWSDHETGEPVVTERFNLIHRA